MNKPNSLFSSFIYKALFGFIGLSLILIIIQLFSFSTNESTEDLQFQNEFLNNYGVYSLSIPSGLSFCEEKIPIEDLDIKERLDKELLSNTYFHSNTLLYFKRANRWFPLIEPILKENNIPTDFKYLAVVESNLSNVISPAGATGFWQLMKSTAKSLGLIVNNEVDERYNVEKSTHAACKYLTRANHTFNNWTLSAAAYNMGIDGIKKQLENQKANNYYDLHLNTETARYLFRILAVKEILENPEKYGFKYRKADLYSSVPAHSVMIDSSVSNLVDFAKKQGISYKTLKIFNPWLRKNRLINNERNQFNIIIPDSGYFVHSLTEPLTVDSGDTVIRTQQIVPGTDSLKD